MQIPTRPVQRNVFMISHMCGHRKHGEEHKSQNLSGFRTFNCMCPKKSDINWTHFSLFSSDRFLIIRRSRLFAGSFHDGWKGFDIYWGPNWIQVKSGHVWKREKKHPETNSESKAHTNWWVPRWISFWDGTSLTFLAKWRISDLCFTLEIWLNVFFLQLFVRGIYFEALMRQNEPSVKSVWKCQFKLYRYPGTRPEKIWLNQTNIYPPQN